jgi:hypothetical protein
MRTGPAGECLAAADALLARRHSPKWVSMSWVTLRPLISSINQLLIGQSATLVPELRAYWADEVVPTPELRVVDQQQADSFVLLGDPGEQDRSQYIVAPVLRRVVERERPAFGFICSDVIYPSGDVNDYVHGLYLPYGPTPPEDPAPGPDPSRLEHLPLYAIPGNHDWHDGLSGFMQNFCGTGPLDRAQLGWPEEVAPAGTRWAEGIRRMLLRRPDAFREQPLWRGAPGEPHTGLLRLPDLRALRGQPTGQPGSYFAIQMREVLLVAIDTGIGLDGGDSAIDAHQGYWLDQVSRRPGPKVLLTGNPLLVNAEWHECAIADPGPQWRGERTAYRSVNEMIADPSLGYVAVIGGDIHNFQHYRVPDDGTRGTEGGVRVVHHVVSGGAGAYMSATHPVRVVQKMREQAMPEQAEADNARRSGPPSLDAPAPATPGAARPVVEPAPSHRVSALPETMIPSPVESLRHFATLLLPRLWRIERALLAFVGGLVLAGVLGPLTGVDEAAVLGWSASALAALVVARSVMPSEWLRRPDFPIEAYRGAVASVAALAGCVAAFSVTWLNPTHGQRHLAGWGALTLGGCLVAWLIRRTGWWRDPAWPQEHLTRGTVALFFGVWFAGLAAALGLGRAALRGARLPARVAGLPSSWLWTVPAVVVLLVGLLGVITFVGVRPAAPGGRLWLRRALPVGVTVQAVAALTCLTYVLYPESPALPWAVVCGALAFPLALAAGALIAVLGLRAACAVAGERSARRWGELGHLGPPAIGIVVSGLIGVQVEASRETGHLAARTAMVAQAVVALVAAIALARSWLTRRSPQDPKAGVAALSVSAAALAVSQFGFARWMQAPALVATYRVQLGTQLTMVTVVLMTFVIDALRRRNRGLAGYRPDATAAVAGLVALIALLDWRYGWIVRSAVASVVIVVLVLVGIAVMHLTYLSAYTLLIDRQAHREHEDLLSAEDARQFMAWRMDPRATPRLPTTRQRRAKTVFPSTDRPQGPIQQKVSEIFDSDEPPFWKNFLHVRTAPGRLSIDVYVVRGDSTIAADAEPRAAIVVPLAARAHQDGGRS